MVVAGLLLLILLLILFGQPLFVIIGAVTGYCFLFMGNGGLSNIIGDLYYGADKEILLAIPLFILAGNLMTHGSIARRLIDVGRSVTAPIPSGLAVAGVISCGIFAAISGSSPVTLIAIGGVMYPALRQAGYNQNFSMGILAAGGTLGIIIPPSIPMIIYAIMVGVSVIDLFLAGIGPGLLLLTALVIYSVFRGWKMERGKWVMADILKSLKSGILALLMPVIILGGIYTGWFTATESAAIAVIYAVFVEILIHRELSLKKLPAIFSESAEMLGTLFLILLLAVSLNKFMTEEQIPQALVEKMSALISNKVGFLIGVNILLLIVGMFMDIMSAILVLAPLLAPMAIHYGINPIHFGIIMIVNLEIGYLTPPVGVNLFVASSIFKVPLGQVIKAVAPIVLVFLVCLGIITSIPEIALFPLKNAGEKQKTTLSSQPAAKTEQGKQLTEEQQVFVGKWKSASGTLEITDDGIARLAPPIGGVGSKYLPKMAEATLEIEGLKSITVKSGETVKTFKVVKAPKTKGEKTTMTLDKVVYTKETTAEEEP
ncbi:TRAP transporter large permease [Turneriella parva]|uniref:TRAP dicarboxylate transporter, DctM subunit n=1 Tax=Turneriella parva (strain ATCC BAA-1111 / DSM 21527 / NCTC 11395 / H) TaxID=869212 RepID=I4B8T9_TURPD|nr:TRAP transporter large permease [Turneriella parva]AFM13696.1 TRAP dicarboxylate transporter, DctM subunit [Turneriella parva DSM 21527]